MFHTMAFRGDLGAAAANVTIPSLNDTIFIQRNSGYIFTDDYAAISFFGLAATLTRIRSNIPSLNAINRHHIYPLNQSATTPSNPGVMDLRKEPLALPKNEVILWEGSNGAAGAEQATLLMSIVPPNWTPEFPAHLQRITVRGQGAITKVANDWSAPVIVTFPDQDLRGGVYSVVGCQAILTGVVAFRLLFPDQPAVSNKQLRPGGPCNEAIGNFPPDILSGGMGEWGRFHTFEPVQVMGLGNAAGAATIELRMDLLYLGTDEGLLQGTL